MKLLTDTNMPSLVYHFSSDYATTIATVKTNIVNRFTLYFYIPDSERNSPSSSTEIKIWTQTEERQPTKVALDRNSDIDDLIIKVLASKKEYDPDLYQAYYGNQQLDPGKHVPSDTTSNQPIVLRKIIPHGKLLL